MIYIGEFICFDYSLLKCIAQSDRDELFEKCKAIKCGHCAKLSFGKDSIKNKEEGEKNARLAKNKKCAKCQKVYHCRKSHQTKAWKIKHKALCL